MKMISAMGHRFQTNLLCADCSVAFSAHQDSQLECAGPPPEPAPVQPSSRVPTSVPIKPKRRKPGRPRKSKPRNVRAVTRSIEFNIITDYQAGRSIEWIARNRGISTRQVRSIISKEDALFDSV